MPLNLVFTQAGTFTIDDNGIPGDGISVIRDSNGVVIFTFANPVDALGLTVSVPGVHLVINFTNSLGAADFSIGDLTNAAITPDSIVMKSVRTTGSVTLVSNSSITEGGADAAADIVAGDLIMSAVSGVGTAGNALETQTSFIEAETTIGGMNIRNTGSVQIGGLTDQVSGLDVVDSGNLILTTIGSIFLSDIDLDPVTNPPNPPAQTVHGGDISGNITLTAQGFLSDIITNTDTDAISAPRGNITLNAGRDIAFGTIGVDFDNDVRANGTVLVNAGRDFLLDGFSDLSSDDFFNNTGGDVIINTGRNIHLRDIAGSDATITASGTAGADVLFTTGSGGAVILDAPSTMAVNSSSGAVIIAADRFIIDGASGITANAGQVTLRPATIGRGMLLGSASDAALAAELADSELDRIFTSQLTLGGDDTGLIRIIAPFSPANIPNLTIRNNTDISIKSSFSAVGALTLRAGNDIYQFGATLITTGGAFSAVVDDIGGDAGLGGIGTFMGAVTAATVTLNGNADADKLNGTGGGETINGGGGNDTLRGNAGNDTLVGGLGNDVLFGGLGDDFFYVDSAGDVVVELVGEGANDRVFASVSYTLGTSVHVERLTTDNNAGTAAINLTGNEIDNVIFGNAGANVLDGRGGADAMVGLGGDDFFYVDNALDTVTEGAADGANDRIFASVSYTQGAGVHVERLTTNNNAGVGAINLTGNELVNIVFGNAGANILDGAGAADTLTGFEGNDTLIGGLGNDTLAGGLGDDNYHVDSAGDVVFEVVGEGANDRIFASVSYTQAAGVHVERLTTNNNAGVGAINLTGNELVNIIFGNAGANTLDGDIGADTLIGLGGNDFYFVDNAGDLVTEGAAEGAADRIFASVSYVQGAGVQVELLTTDNNAGVGAINLTGNELANTIYGNAGANVLDGKGAADTLIGLGAADTFAFTTALGGGNIDAISGFVVADDTIRLENAVFTGLAAGALAAGAFNTGAAATQADDRVIYNNATGALLFDADGLGGAAGVQFATLAAGLALTAADFIVV